MRKGEKGGKVKLEVTETGVNSDFSSYSLHYWTILLFYSNNLISVLTLPGYVAGVTGAMHTGGKAHRKKTHGCTLGYMPTRIPGHWDSCT